MRQNFRRSRPRSFWYFIMGLDAAVHRTVDECIQEGILEEFLRSNRAEVEKVSIFEYDKEEEERKLREAEREVGREEGEAAGRASGFRDGVLQKARKVTLALAERNMPLEEIAQIVGMEESVIRKWIAEK